MTRRLRYVPLSAWLLVTGCAAVEWLPPPTTETWRGKSLHHDPAGLFAASDADAARERTELFARLRAAIERSGIVPVPPMPLVIVVEPEDELLLGDAVATAALLAEWHRRGTRALRPDVDATVDEARPVPKPKDAPAAVLDAAAHAIGSALPIDDDRLAFPASWRASARCCVLVPSEASLARAVDRMIDAGLAEQDISFGQRLLMAPLLPFVRGEVRDELRRQVFVQVAEALAAAALQGHARPIDEVRRLLAAVVAATEPN